MNPAASRFSQPGEFAHLSDADREAIREIFSGLGSWEEATGKIKQRSELYALYKRPGRPGLRARLRRRQPSFGGSPQEGIVYFPEVLEFYLRHRPAARLFAPPALGEPLEKVLARVR